MESLEGNLLCTYPNEASFVVLLQRISTVWGISIMTFLFVELLYFSTLRTDSTVYIFFPKPQEQLPFTVSRISVVGAAGQGTTIGGYRELDLAVFVKGTMFDTNCNP